MASARLPSDEQMARWREEGRLICDCSDPRPRQIDLWHTMECRACHRLVVRGGAELLRRRAQLADQQAAVS